METREQILNAIVRRGMRIAKLRLETATLSTGGIPRVKTRTQQRDETVRLEQIADILDLLQWYGPWGQTSHAIQLELIRRAKEGKDK